MTKLGQIILIIMFFISCKEERAYNIEQEAGTTSEIELDHVVYISTSTHTTINEHCELVEFIEKSNVPKLAQDLFRNNAENNDTALEFFEKLKSNEKVEREFYFKVLTNLYKVADGSTAEGLGYRGLDYIVNSTPYFLDHFENEVCFSDEDLAIWSKIAMLELRLKIENEKDAMILDRTIATIKANSLNSSPSEKTTLKTFINYLTREGKNN